MTQIHIGRGTKNLGAFTEEEVRRGLLGGQFFRTDLGWRIGMEGWKPLSEFGEFIVYSSVEPVTRAVESTKKSGIWTKLFGKKKSVLSYEKKPVPHPSTSSFEKKKPASSYERKTVAHQSTPIKDWCSHDWSKDCHKCTFCGKQRGVHVLSKDGERCEICRTNKNNFRWSNCRTFHDWSRDCGKCSKCGLTSSGDVHRWYGCKCSECGKTRDQDHDWSRDCQWCWKCFKTRDQDHKWAGCKCSTCGKTRDRDHKWTGCKCSICGKTRDQDHEWSNDCLRCSKCHKTRLNAHEWSGCKCSKCGKTRNQDHDWSIDKEKCAKCGIAREGFDYLMTISELPPPQRAIAMRLQALTFAQGVPECPRNMKYVVEYMLKKGLSWNWSKSSVNYRYSCEHGLGGGINICRYNSNIFTIMEEEDYRDGIEIFTKSHYI